MTYLRYRFFKNVFMLLVGFALPPLYFLIRKRFWIAISALAIMVVAPGQYGVLFCMAIALLAGINQMFTDWKYRGIIMENAPDDKTYKAVAWVLRVLGVKCVDYSDPKVPAATNIN